MCRAQASDLGSGPHPRNLEQPHAATSISIKSVGKARIRRPSPFHLDPTVNCPPDALGLASVMTRPKVPEDKRQRTATACDSCKRRKQKVPPPVLHEQDDEASPAAAAARPAPKRRLTEEQSGNGIFSAQFNSDSVLPNQAGPRPDHQPSKPRGWSFNDHMQSGSAGIAGDHQDPYHVEAGASSIEHAASSAQPSLKGVDDKATAAPMSRGATTNGSDEEAVIYHQSRMLQDPTGRLLYVGDSATLSYLQLIRMMVENVAGPSPFTTDPRRHRIMESQFTMPSNTRHTHLLPDKKTAYVLVDAFFINTHGLVHMFDRQSFLNSVRSCYVDPLSTDPTWLCHLNLVFAIGLMLATPRAGTTEAAIIEKLLKDDLDRAEIFYLNAKSLSDPLTGFEDAGFWSIQALFLMAVYMLTKSKRNAAFAAFGTCILLLQRLV
ncbi:hypothetical protein LTR16_000026 [Cryomyces antarcticus]|uniref:Xylanolytic transcriptional activator regulatory domain-containing protein n=1 Tax=Cryomyces antarcticus TaxID=329879 RepID=A0ABR0M0H0_9PEZI|nr:hypothetical protein LTR16_000026 [Cryomyces antarcticus]